MKTATLSRIAFAALACASACLLSSCETTSSGRTASRTLPAYEPPIARNDFQTVRTTAYTHSEADHLEYGARNALGGRLQSASSPRGRVETPPRAVRVSEVDDSDVITIAYTSHVKKSSASTKNSTKKSKATRSKKSEPQIGSAAADWSRWPLGTTFRIISTGQIYKIDDYGWALAGRNTIDLYMGNRSDMNSWGVRNEPIQILRWGDSGQSIRVLQPRLAYKHCRRMVLELQGQHQEAAALN